MFEMKNELDDGENKRRTELFRKLDDDRRRRAASTPVLVSLLEPEKRGSTTPVSSTFIFIPVCM